MLKHENPYLGEVLALGEVVHGVLQGAEHGLAEVGDGVGGSGLGAHGLHLAVLPGQAQTAVLYGGGEGAGAVGLGLGIRCGKLCGRSRVSIQF